MSGVHGDIIPAKARRRGSSARKWGVLPGLSDKTNGLPTDDMNAGGHPDKVLPREPSMGPAGEEWRLLRDPQNSSGNTAEAGARNAAPPSRESFRERMK